MTAETKFEPFNVNVRIKISALWTAMLIGAVLLGVAVAAGCGDGSESKSDSTETPTSERGRDSGACEPQEVVVEVGVPPTFAAADDAFAEAVASTFCSPSWTFTSPDGTQRTYSPRPVLDQQEALCIGDRIVDELGVSRSA